MKAKLMLVLLPVFFAACGGSEEKPVQQKEEESGVEEIEATPTPTPAGASTITQEEWMKMSPAEKEKGEKGPATNEPLHG